MPEVSRFFGIIIRMFYSDQVPPHFHAIYGTHEALVAIATLELYRGSIPRRAMALVEEWADLHRGELMENWERARAGLPLEPIVPLE
ncbi:MAG: DUF4160 domain-containing protein [bacterium]